MGQLIKAKLVRQNMHDSQFTLNASNLENIASGQTILSIVLASDDTCFGFSFAFLFVQQILDTRWFYAKLFLYYEWKLRLKFIDWGIKEFRVQARFSIV